MALTGSQRKQLHAALLAAFPDRAALAQMVAFELGQNLNVISQAASLGEDMLALIQWAEARTQVEALIAAARAANPSNALLTQAAAQIADVAGAAPSGPPPPRGAPLPPAPWADRAEWAPLHAVLRAGTPGTRAVEGQGGSGKTGLAARLAWDAEVRTAYPDGVLWVTLGPRPDMAGALATLAAALGADVTGLLNEEARAAAVRDLLAGRRCLLLVDDVWDEAVARRFRDLAPAAALLTTADQPVAHAFAPPEQDTVLQELDYPSAVFLLRALAPAADEALLARVAGVAEGLPLTLRLLAPEMQREARLGGTLDRFLQQLADPAWRGNKVAAILGTSVDLLPDEADRAAFAALAVFGARPATFDAPAAAALWATDEDTARDRLLRFLDRNLVDAEGGGRVSLHQSLADLAAARLQTATPDNPDPTATIHKLKSTHAAYYLALVDRDRTDWRTIAPEWPQIRRAWEAVQGDDAQTLALLWAVGKFQALYGLWRDYVSWVERGLAAARALGQPQAEATLLHNLGWAYNALGERPQAVGYYRQALALAEAAGDRAGQATTLNSLGLVYDALGERPQALACYEQALALQEALGDRAGQAHTLNSLGLTHANLGDRQRALGYFEQALALAEAVGDQARQASTLSNIGAVYSELGDQQQALAYYARALPLREAVGDRAGQATTLNNLGMVYQHRGEWQRARAYFEQALPLHEAVGDRAGQALALNNLGGSYRMTGDHARARGYYEQALALHEAVGNRAGQAQTLSNLGELGLAAGDYAAARAYFEQALPLAEAVGDRAGQALALNNLGTAHAMSGGARQALGYLQQALALAEAVGDRAQQSLTQYNLAMIYRAMGDLAAAERLLEEAVALKTAIQHPDLAGDQAMLDQVRAERAQQK